MSEKQSYRVEDSEFIRIVKTSKNIHQALISMDMSPIGAAYKIFRKRCEKLCIELPHLKNDEETRVSTSEKDVIDAVESTHFRTECLSKLGLDPTTKSNINWITWRIQTLGISVSHWGGCAAYSSNRLQRVPRLEDILVDGRILNTSHKNNLIKLGALKYNCYWCGIDEWRSEKLSLHLDHINGCNTDNRLENLRLLCPNCHSQTPTYCRGQRRKTHKEKKKSFTYSKPGSCSDCSTAILSTSIYCRKCVTAHKLHQTKIDWPSREDLLTRLQTMSVRALARELGVSDNSIRKRLRNH